MPYALPVAMSTTGITLVTREKGMRSRAMMPITHTVLMPTDTRGRRTPRMDRKLARRVSTISSAAAGIR
jgi:hypothetical protein